MTATERLILFGRLPEAGRTKTRLEPALGPEGAARLYRAFLHDAVRLAFACRVTEREIWVPDRPDAIEKLEVAFPRIPVRLQSSGDLGERLRAAFQTAFDEGAEAVVIVGTDHPTLPPGRIDDAFGALRTADVAVGPTEDGGYYAIGLRRYCWPVAAGLFVGAPWSRPNLTPWTRRRARQLDLAYVDLPEWYDVDGPEDIERLRRDVDPESRTAAVLSRLS